MSIPWQPYEVLNILTSFIREEAHAHKHPTGADPGMKKRGGTLLLAGDSVHSAPSMDS